VDIRRLAEFYRQLLGYTYRLGDEVPPAGTADRRAAEWLVLVDEGRPRLTFQPVDQLPPVTWPDGPVPQQLHLDLTVADPGELLEEHARATSLGATLLEDRRDDPEEPLLVYADPEGHPFCIFVAAAPARCSRTGRWVTGGQGPAP
jgi:catechol 2,3-dioxygenase-like lactoylglutathione lyase family enzyme